MTFSSTDQLPPWISEPRRACFEDRGSPREQVDAGFELLERALTHSVAVLGAVRGELPKQLQSGSGRLTLGGWTELLAIVSDRDKEQSRRRWWAGREDVRLFRFIDDASFWEKVDAIVNLRNDVNHGRALTNAATVQRAREQLRAILRSLDPILSLPLYFIEQTALRSSGAQSADFVVTSATSDHLVQARIDVQRPPDRCACVLLPDDTSYLVEPLLHVEHFDGMRHRTVRLAIEVQRPLHDGHLRFYGEKQIRLVRHEQGPHHSWPLPAGTAARLRDPAPAEAPRLPDIEIEEELGRGASGVVFAAKSTRRGLPRDLAIKVLRPEAARNERSLQRFEREAAVLRQLDHRGVVACFDIEIDPSGKHCLLLERARGQSLERWVTGSRDPFKADQVYGLVATILDTLAEVHARGIVHRDIKPSNLMLADDNSVRILDFGVAAFDDGRSLTRTSDGLGTPNWSAPEQADAPDKVDGRADLYALGRLILKLAPDDDTSIALRAVGRYATAPRPTDRPADAAAMADALRRAHRDPTVPLIAGELVGAYRVTQVFPVLGRWIAEVAQDRLGAHALAIVLWGPDGRAAEARLRDYRDERVRAAEPLRDAWPGSFLLCVDTHDASEAVAIAQALIDGTGPVARSRPEKSSHREGGPSRTAEPASEEPSPKTAAPGQGDPGSNPIDPWVPYLIGAGIGAAALAGIVGGGAALGVGTAAVGAAVASQRKANAKEPPKVLSPPELEEALDKIAQQLLVTPIFRGGRIYAIPAQSTARLLEGRDPGTRMLLVGATKPPNWLQRSAMPSPKVKKLASELGARGVLMVWPDGAHCVELLPDGRSAARKDIGFLAEQRG